MNSEREQWIRNRIRDCPGKQRGFSGSAASAASASDGACTG